MVNSLGAFETIWALLGAVLIGIFMIGLLDHRYRTIFKMGVDSAAVIASFAADVALVAQFLQAARFRSLAGRRYGSFDIAHDILYRIDLLGIRIGYRNAELIFERHHQFDDIKAVATEVTQKTGLGRHLVGIDPHMLDHDFDNTSAMSLIWPPEYDARCRRAIFWLAPRRVAPMPGVQRLRTNSARSTRPLMPSYLQSISCASPVRRIDLMTVPRFNV